MPKPMLSSAAALIAAGLLALHVGPAAAQSKWGPGADDAVFEAMLKSSFADRGIVKTTRLTQDETQAFCSLPDNATSPAAAAQREKIEAINLAAVKWPSDGTWLGDWKEGEKIAQSGRGLTWTDKADQVNGGNCYNCHQITAEEISHGTIGPSLLGYGKMVGTGEEAMKTVWARIYNSKAVNACSNMPRGGHKGIIDETQIKHLMALLLDPQSPVNK